VFLFGHSPLHLTQTSHRPHTDLTQTSHRPHTDLTQIRMTWLVQLAVAICLLLVLDVSGSGFRPFRGGNSRPGGGPRPGGLQCASTERRREYSCLRKRLWQERCGNSQAIGRFWSRRCASCCENRCRDADRFYSLTNLDGHDCTPRARRRTGFCCQDIDECAATDPAFCPDDQRTECINEMGSASCECKNAVVTWYKQERDDITNYIKQDNLPELTALTLCFRFKPLELNHDDPQGGRFIISISDQDPDGGFNKKWNLGIRTNPSLSFGLAPNSYFTDGTDNEVENSLWKEEHKHCFVWEEGGDFKWFVDNDPAQPGQLSLFRTSSGNNVEKINAGGSLVALQEQDTLGGGLDEDQLTPGWIAQLNLYGRAMSDNEVLQMNMFCEEKGDVVSEDTIVMIGNVDTAPAEFECVGCVTMVP